MTPSALGKGRTEQRPLPSVLRPSGLPNLERRHEKRRSNLKFAALRRRPRVDLPFVVHLQEAVHRASLHQREADFRAQRKDFVLTSKEDVGKALDVILCASVGRLTAWLSLSEDFTISLRLLHKRTDTVAKRAKSLPRIPKAHRLSGSPLSRKDVTRGEYNRIIDTLNERAIMLNEFRSAINALQQASEVQFKRIAQIQAQVDRLNRAWSRMKVSQ